VPSSPATFQKGHVSITEMWQVAPQVNGWLLATPPAT